MSSTFATLRAGVALAFAGACAAFCAVDLCRRSQTRAELPRLGGEIRLDLNAASPAELSALPGVGPKTAATLVADRAARGRFASPADLGRVPGIGPAKIRGLERWVEAGE